MRSAGPATIRRPVGSFPRDATMHRGCRSLVIGPADAEKARVVLGA
ncbi:MAG: hypothetical protein ACR2NB_14265 [Solirubrobacteraceae bacterium]